jgi:hypothetical protein
MELVHLVLGEEADAELVRAGEAAARDGEAVGQELGERRLASPLRPRSAMRSSWSMRRLRLCRTMWLP